MESSIGTNFSKAESTRFLRRLKEKWYHNLSEVESSNQGFEESELSLSKDQLLLLLKLSLITKGMAIRSSLSVNLANLILKVNFLKLRLRLDDISSSVSSISSVDSRLHACGSRHSSRHGWSGSSSSYSSSYGSLGTNRNLVINLVVLVTP